MAWAHCIQAVRRAEPPQLVSVNQQQNAAEEQVSVQSQQLATINQHAALPGECQQLTAAKVSTCQGQPCEQECSDSV